MSLPLVYRLDHPGQTPVCLKSLAEYAREISETSRARRFADLGEVVQWTQAQPVRLDLGEGPRCTGCTPSQRCAVWPERGLNCWEATGHYLGVALALAAPLEIYLLDRDFRGQRHVFPAVRDIGSSEEPIPVILQPAVLPGVLPAQGWARRQLAQAWYNTIADVTHSLGTGVLNVFGLGGFAPAAEQLWSLAPSEYGLSKNKPPEPPPGEAPTAVPPPLPPTPAEVAASENDRYWRDPFERAPYAPASSAGFTEPELALLRDPRFVALLQKATARLTGRQVPQQGESS
jgi:hypothetical protein